MTDTIRHAYLKQLFKLHNDMEHNLDTLKKEVASGNKIDREWLDHLLVEVEGLLNRWRQLINNLEVEL